MSTSNDLHRLVMQMCRVQLKECFHGSLYFGVCTLHCHFMFSHWILHFAVCSLQFTLLILQFAVCSLHSTHCVLQFTLLTLHFAVCNLHFTLCTQGFAVYTWGWLLPLPPHPVDECPYSGDMLHIIACIYYKYK